MGQDETTNARIARHNPMADDGDAQRFCSTCAFGSVCIGRGVDERIGLPGVDRSGIRRNRPVEVGALGAHRVATPHEAQHTQDARRACSHHPLWR